MIRTIIDTQGKQWDVTLGRESYGMQVLLFFPKNGEGIRKAMLSANTRLEASDELSELDEIALQERLDASVGWEEDILTSR